MPWGSAQRRCAAAGYAALVLACVLAIYVLTRASEPDPWAGGPGCTSAWGALPVASNCDALLAELRSTPACGAPSPKPRCCALAAEAAAGRCHCRASAYLGTGAALAAVRARCHAGLGGGLDTFDAGLSAGGLLGESALSTAQSSTRSANSTAYRQGRRAGTEKPSRGTGSSGFTFRGDGSGGLSEGEGAGGTNSSEDSGSGKLSEVLVSEQHQRSFTGSRARRRPQPQRSLVLPQRALPSNGRGSQGDDGGQAGTRGRGGVGAVGEGDGGAADAPLRVLVGVLTAVANADARAAIRATWGADARLHRHSPGSLVCSSKSRGQAGRVVFVCAKPAGAGALAAVRAEGAATGDLVLLPDVWEGYANITHQTLEVLRVAALDPAVTHVLKADDDSYVRVGPLLARLAAAPRRRLFLGWIDADPGGPHRDPSHTWFVARSEWAPDAYPRWAHGAGYVLTQDLAREIAAGAALAAGNGTLFRLEDVAVGSWVAFVAAERGWDIAYVDDRRFNYNGCAARDIVSHYVRPAAARCMFAADGRCCDDRG